MKYERKNTALIDAIELIGGGTPKTSVHEYWGGDIPWLSVKDFNNDNRYVYVTEKTITQKGLENSSTKLLQKDDIIISARGTVGEMAMIPFPMAFNQSCYGIRAKDGHNAAFLYYLIKSSISQLKSMTHGSVFDTITRDTFANICVQIPDADTQEKIASILTAIDDTIENNQKINDNLQQQLAAIYKSWYQDFDNATGELVETEYGLVPLGWQYVLAGDLCQSISVTHKFDKDNLVFLNTGDIENGRFLHSNLMAVKDMPGQAKKTIAPGDILFSEIRPINRHFAFVNFPSNDYVVSTKLMVIRAKSFDSRRLYHLLTSDNVLSELQLQAESRSGTFPQIRFENVSKLPILIADERTEESFTEILHTVYNQIEYVNRENEKLSELRDNLLPKLMSGEIDVSDVEI